MTTTNDLDRALAAWLSDGPARAPEPPIAAAVEHARANPRRRDLLAAVRSDPMAPRGRSILGLRPVLVLAVVALLAATIGIGVVGSQLGITPNTPISSPGPSVPASPSASPSPTPAPTPVRVSIIDALGKDVTATIEDASGLLTGASSETPSDGGVVAGDELAVTNDGPNRLRLEWTDLPCGAQYAVTIDASVSAITVSREACGGDLLPMDRILVLEFSGPVDATGVAGSVDLPVAGE
ncbi:MAG: hypothetical protein AB1627_12130 [Chloroflexota bacterium]